MNMWLFRCPLLATNVANKGILLDTAALKEWSDVIYKEPLLMKIEQTLVWKDILFNEITFYY
jgi:hypothetical protein